MFINCRHCHALVATDPATDLPPERCPRCAGVLRRSEAGPPPAAADVASAAPARPPPGDATGAPASAPRAEAAAPLTPDVAARLQPRVAPRVDAPPAASAPAPAPASVPAPVPASPAPEPRAAVPAALATTASAPAQSGLRATAPAKSGAAAPTDPAAVPPAADAASAPPGGSADRAPAPDASMPPAPAPIDAATTAAVPGRAADMPAQVAAPARGPGTSPQDASPAPETATPAPGPGFLAGRVSGGRTVAPRRRAWRIAAVAGLLAMLALQMLLADRARLAADARWRPLVAAACGVFGCSLPPWRDPSAFTLVSREVRPHPQAPDALRVRATFRNDARWAQAWPPLVLTLSDVDGRAVAARAFRAEEYLGSDAPARLAAGQSADIQLDIREPSAATVSYAFGFGD